MASVTRREFVRDALAAGGVGTLWVAGVGKSAAAKGAPAQAKGLTLRALVYPYPPTQMVRDALPEYEKLTGVKVEWQEAPFNEALAKQMAELVANTDRYDVFITSNKWVGAEAGTGQLQVLDDMIGKAGTALDWDDFMAKQRKMYSYQGKVYGIPLSSNIMMAAYRKDIFDKEGIKVPPVGTSFTHSEWLSILRRLTKDKQKGTAFVIGKSSGLDVWSNVLVSAGGHWFDEKLNPVFNSKTGLMAAEYILELIKNAPADQLQFGNTEANEVMMNGRVVTQTFQWASRIPMVEDPKKSRVVGKVGWSTLPLAELVPGRKTGLAVNDGWAFTIPKASKNRQAAFDLAVWAVTKEKQTTMVDDLQAPPSRISVFDKAKLHQKYIWLPVMKEQLDNSYDYPTIPEWAEVGEKATAELVSGWAGQYSLKEALNRINESVITLMKERKYPVGTWKGDKLPWE